MAGKLIADTLENGTGSTFDLASSISQLARVKTYQVTDSTDTSLSTSAANVGSTFSAVIPTKGLIVLSPTFRITIAAGFNAYIGWGIRIGSTDYYMTGSNNGAAIALSYSYEGINTTSGQYAQINSPITGQYTGSGALSFFGGQLAFDIQGESIPTGTQTVQLRCIAGAATATLKGTAVITRINVAIFDHS